MNSVVPHCNATIYIPNKISRGIFSKEVIGYPVNVLVGKINKYSGISTYYQCHVGVGAGVGGWFRYLSLPRIKTFFGWNCEMLCSNSCVLSSEGSTIVLIVPPFYYLFSLYIYRYIYTFLWNHTYIFQPDRSPPLHFYTPYKQNVI